jgi:hypothetical protein
MNLAAVSSNQVVRSWIKQRPTEILFHQDACCINAKNWLIAMGRSFAQRNLSGTEMINLSWLKGVYQWGAMVWPQYACRIVERTEVDCGAFAAFARIILEDHAIPHYSAQIIQLVGKEQVRHIDQIYRQVPGAFRWIFDDFVYHEVVAIAGPNNTVRIFDPTESQWISPGVRAIGGVAAIRIESPEPLQWGPNQLEPEIWNLL